MPHPTWEYLVKDHFRDGELGPLGLKGWELVSVCYVGGSWSAYFKRRLVMDLGEAWQRVVAGVLARKALLGSVLQHATPIAVRDGGLAIALPAMSRFHQELLADRANRDLIHQVIAEHVPGAHRLDV